MQLTKKATAILSSACLVAALPSCKERSDFATNTAVSNSLASLPVVPDENVPFNLKDFTSYTVTKNQPYLQNYVNKSALHRFELFELPILGFIERNGRMDFLTEKTMLKAGDRLVISPVRELLGAIHNKDLADLTGNSKRFLGFQEEVAAFHSRILEAFLSAHENRAVENTVKTAN